MFVENFVKRAKRLLESKVDLHSARRSDRQLLGEERRDYTCYFLRMKISNTSKSNTLPFFALSLL